MAVQCTAGHLLCGSTVHSWTPAVWQYSAKLDTCCVAVQCTAGHLPKAASCRIYRRPSDLESSPLSARSVAIAPLVALRLNEILLSGNACCRSAVLHGAPALPFVKNTNIKTYRLCNPPLFPATFICRELQEYPQTHSNKSTNQSQIYCSSFKYSSTCFGHPLAHHQELINCSSRF